MASRSPINPPNPSIASDPSTDSGVEGEIPSPAADEALDEECRNIPAVVGTASPLGEGLELLLSILLRLAGGNPALGNGIRLLPSLVPRGPIIPSPPSDIVNPGIIELPLLLVVMGL